MTIQNQTKQTILAQNAIEAISLIEQTLGLLKYPTPVAILIKTRWGIHTFFMKYPIDVLVLDNSNKVAAIKENMMPNQLYFWNVKHTTILELPSGTIKKTKTSLNDQLTIS